MRTTIDFDEDVLSRLKQHAAKTGRSMSSLVEDAVREMLARGARRAAGGRIKLPTFKGDGVRPGVDLWDSAALLEIMEEKPR